MDDVGDRPSHPEGAQELSWGPPRMYPGQHWLALPDCFWLQVGKEGDPGLRFLLGANRGKPCWSQAQRRQMKGNSWDSRNEDCKSLFGLAAGSVPAVSSFSSLNYRENVYGGSPWLQNLPTSLQCQLYHSTYKTANDSHLNGKIL